MNTRRWMLLTGAALFGPPLSKLANQKAGAMASLEVTAVHEPLPSLSIVIPARNESRNLKRLLPSLQSGQYPGPLEIIVIDDQSQDDTAAVAESHGANVLKLNHLPSGWLGKPYACHRGAALASGRWLLFTDADTIHSPHGPASAVRYAVTQGLDGLSAFLNQEMTSLWERLALSVAFAGLFASLQASTPLMNGQYILLNRHVYESSGGFAAVAGEKVEDVALAHHLQAGAYRVPCLWAADAATVRMYEDARSLWYGLTRLGAGTLPWSGRHSLLSIVYITAISVPLLAAVGWLRGRLPRWWLGLSWSLSALSYSLWFKRFGRARWAPLAPLGGLMVMAAALVGLVAGLFGRRIRWKGRLV
ncbi:MAG: glycosyltransferase [Candidatus Promineifilaceae bacterium]|nr:glycosyltransferase [Candidatus Promineifilaceae bacterium]